MKTLSKVLSVLIVVVMCVSCFGASAYAIDLFADSASQNSDGGIDLFGEPASVSPASDGGIDLNVDAPAQQSVAPAQSASQPAQNGGEDLNISDSATFNAAAGSVAVVGNVACKDADEINAALASGGSTITFVKGASFGGEIIVNKAATIDLNGATFSGTLTVNANLTIKDSTNGSGKVTGSINKLGGEINVTGGTYASAITVKDYITSDYKVVKAGSDDKVVKKSDNPDVSAGTVAIVDSKECDNADAINEQLAKDGSHSVKLVDDVTGPLSFLKGGTLDLNGHKLSGDINTYGSVSITDSANGSGTLDGNINKMNGSVKISGGTFPKHADSAKKLELESYLASGKAFDASHKVIDKSSTYVATVNGTGYTTLKEAYDAAQNGDTIVLVENTSSASDVDASALGTINKNVNFSLGSNGLTGVTINAATVGFSGGKVSDITCTNGGVNVNGSKVASLKLTDSTLNMGSGVIDDLTASNSKLYVSGGEVKKSAISGTTTRAITGGTWTDPSTIANFEASIADGYEKSGDNPYTIKSKSGSSTPGGSGSSANGYVVSPTSYARNSGTTVTVSMPDSDYTKFYYSKNSDGTNAYQIDGYSVSGTTLTLQPSFLNSLSDGTWYLYVVKSSGAQLMGSVYVYTNSSGSGSGSTISGGSWSLSYVNGSKWYGGDDTLEFYSDLFLPGAAVDPSVRVDTKSAPNKTISVLQYWDLGKGYFKLGNNLLNSLSANEVYYIQVYDAANPTETTNILTFTVGPTLKAIDTDKHVINSTKNLKFLCSDQIARVYVGPIELTSDDDFALSNNRKTVTLSAEFLNKRSAGSTYTIKVLTYSGDYASTTFQILTTGQASSSPRTGDASNLGLWAAFLLLSGTAVVVLLPKLRKHED